MDRILRRELDGIGNDDSSGAAELTGRTIKAVRAWLRRYPHAGPTELLETAKRLLHTQPSMAPMLRLANDVVSASTEQHPPSALQRALNAYKKQLDRSPKKIAQLFHRWLKRRRKKWQVITYSYSSTVASSLVRARRCLEWVECAEGRPALEGRRMAEQLARASIDVQLDTDAELIDAAFIGDLFVCGADAVTPDGFFNKVGTASIVHSRAAAAKLTVVLAETVKFWPESPFHSELLMWTYGDSRTVWKDPPAGVRVNVELFSCGPFTKGVTVLTEKGWMTPRQVRRELKKIRISPHLKELID